MTVVRALPRKQLAVLALALAASGAVWSQAAQGGPGWAQLSAAQREALAPLKDNWSALDGQSKEKWIDVAGRYHAMTPDTQSRVQARMAEWSRLSPEQRGRARQNFQESRQLPPQERQKRWEAYQAMTPEQRQEFNERNRQRDRGGDVPPPPRTVSPSSVQAQPGASTTLLSREAKPPVHQQPGMPKISATPDFVDRSTLLPQRGPQGAGMSKVPPPAEKPGKQKKHQ